MSTAIIPADRRTDAAAFEPSSIDEALSVSKLLVSSRLLPRSIATPEAAFAVIVTGRELGLSAMQSLRAIHIVEGKPTLSADLMVALVKRSEACLFFRLVESTAERALYETHRRGDPSPTKLGFTIEEAKAAGVTAKDNWRKYPGAMLRARCAAALARAVYPDLVLGVYDPDELATIDVTPTAAPAPAPAPVPAPAPARVETPVEAPAPAARRRAKAEPAPVQAAPVQEIVDVEIVEEPEAAPAAPAGGGEPPRPSIIDRLVASIQEAGDLAAARVVLQAAPLAELDADGIGRAFAALLSRCSTASECNDVATVVVAWKKAGAVPDATVGELRRAYLARKESLLAASKGA